MQHDEGKSAMSKPFVHQGPTVLVSLHALCLALLRKSLTSPHVAKMRARVGAFQNSTLGRYNKFICRLKDRLERVLRCFGSP